MSATHKIIIAGAGGVGQAVALILTEFSETPPQLFIGNRTLEKAENVVQWIRLGTAKAVRAQPFHLRMDEPTEDMRAALEAGDVLLDCLPGRFAPRMARLARQYNLGYANLTEYVQETREIVDIARGADKGFVLQTGLAPGFINVLAMGLFRRFCEKFKVETAGYLAMKVGALTRHATAPHYYGFTWSPVGVATEYVRDTVCLRNYQPVTMPALSERENIIINGLSYEADLTSGGAADLPEALSGKVKRLDYKTLRYPGHYDWVCRQLEDTPTGRDRIEYLQQRMESGIPHLQDDMVLIYASVEGKDHAGVWQKIEHTYNLHPQPMGRHVLRAIQSTTAAPLAQAAELLLTGNLRGPVFQSAIDPDTFLNGRYVKAVYGKWNGGEVIPGGAQYKVK
jgi:saccharopine dehydrogenase-like NADP-dependent oxidoreductase